MERRNKMSCVVWSTNGEAEYMMSCAVWFIYRKAEYDVMCCVIHQQTGRIWCNVLFDPLVERQNMTAHPPEERQNTMSCAVWSARGEAGYDVMYCVIHQRRGRIWCLVLCDPPAERQNIMSCAVWSTGGEAEYDVMRYRIHQRICRIWCHMLSDPQQRGRIWCHVLYDPPADRQNMMSRAVWFTNGEAEYDVTCCVIHQWRGRIWCHVLCDSPMRGRIWCQGFLCDPPMERQNNKYVTG